MAQSTQPIQLSVDLTQASRGIFHSQMTFPAKPGPMTLVYPKWIPGDHSPSGPIVNVVGVKFSAGGKTIPWRRDEVDMFAFHCDVPAGATEMEASFDSIGNDSEATPQLAVLEWNRVVLYPQGKTSDEVTVAPRLRLPAGWKSATALPAAAPAGEWLTFKPVSLTTLVDSPVLSGANFRAIPLANEQAPHELDLVSDSTSALNMKPETIAKYNNLVSEAGHFSDHAITRVITGSSS